MAKATAAVKTRKPNVGSDPTKGARVKRWQVGLYAFGIGASLILLVANLMLIINGAFSPIFLIIAMLVAGLSWTLVIGNNSKTSEAPGTKISAEPALTEFVQSIAAAVDAPMPDSIHLATEAQLGVVEHTRFFGLKVESSALVIGLPFVHALTQRELAALLAHELAHYTPGEIAHGPRAIRSLQSARDLIAIERNGFVNGIYGSYARKMFRSVGGVGVAQEEAADRIAADAYGTEALRSALGQYDDTSVAYDQLLREYVVPALQNGMHPEDMFGGFTEFLQSRIRTEDRSRDLERRQGQERVEFELHRSPQERLATLDAGPSSNGSETTENGDDPAYSLLDPESKSAEIVVGRWASKLMNDATSPQSWDQLCDQVYSDHASNIASLAFEGELDAQQRFEQALGWSQTKDWGTVDAAVAKPLKKTGDVDARRTEWAECLVTEVAADSGSFAWQHNWHGAPILAASSGSSFDAAPIAALLIAGKVDQVKAALQAANL